LGGLFARTRIQGQEVPLAIDTAFPTSSLAKAVCPQTNLSNWDYTGTLDVWDGMVTPAARRASFRNVGLFNLCPGAIGDATIQPSAVLGGSLLHGFSVQLELPRETTASASMTLWPIAPVATDEWYADHATVSLRFDLRGAASLTRDQGKHIVTLPNTRVVLGACLAPDAFSPSDPRTTCPAGMALQNSSGIDALLVVSTGTGPLVLSETTFSRIATRLSIAMDEGRAGELLLPLSSSPVPAHFFHLPRLALLTSRTSDSWQGTCAELARARRIERVLTHQDAGACFERCDASGSQAVQSAPYLELGGEILTAVISDTSDLMRSLNIDAPTNARVDGILGAGTLAGTNIEIDYLSKPQSRFIASCADESDRSECFASPACPGLSEPGQTHRCFGLTERGYAPVCD
jgi:hypothetical protein